MAVVNFDMSQFREFFQRMDKAAKGDLREELETYLRPWASTFCEWCRMR